MTGPKPSQRRGPTVLLGGTFDPPHVGHLVLAECARQQFDAETAVFLPAGDPWRKTAPGDKPAREVRPAEHRVAMVRLATEGDPRFAIDERELRREGPTYTVDTLEELRAEGHGDIVLVVGADALNDMEHWKDPDRIRSLARIAAAAKPGATLPAGGYEVVDMPPLAISSTLIRSRVRAGLPVRYLVPPAVDDYIREHGLYRDAER